MAHRASSAAPPPAVLAAFGVPASALTRLPGGQGHSWLAARAGAAGGSGQPSTSVVLKPVTDDVGVEEVTWVAEALSGLPQPQCGFRLPCDVADSQGRWVVDGWRASTHLPGRAGPARHWAELLATARAFTAAVAHLPRPALLDRRTHPWAVADRAAWDEQPLSIHPDQQTLVRRLRVVADRTQPPERPEWAGQLVHGDLTSNVLFADGLPPAIIDISPYWRPAACAGAVVVADGLLWWEQGAGLVVDAGTSGHLGLVARAVLFRLLTQVELLRTSGGTGQLPPVEAGRYRRAAEVLDDLTG